MKRFTLAVMAVVLFASFAFAQNFGAFSVDVPDGWNAGQNGPTAILSKPDNSGNISITVADSEGIALKDLADAFRAEFAKSFASVGEAEELDGDYEWEMTTANGVESHALISGADGKYLLIVVTGEVNEDEVAAVMGAISFN